MNIYYCWFGGKPLSSEIKTMIKTWEEFFPGVSIVEINEQNFDINLYPYAKTAYDEQKYAFVSDCARVHYLYHYGGIYFDTDVEVIQSFETLFSNNHIESFTNPSTLLMSMEYFFHEITGVSTAVIISGKNHPLLNDLLKYYSENDFKNILEPETINEKINKLLVNKSVFVYKDKKQEFMYDEGKVVLVRSNLLMQNKEGAYAIHHLDGSWQNSLSIPRKLRRIFGIIVKKIIGRERFERIWKK